jgi:hypothetical protein
MNEKHKLERNLLPHFAIKEIKTPFNEIFFIYSTGRVQTEYN